jgi:hypothetical protein
LIRRVLRGRWARLRGQFPHVYGGKLPQYHRMHVFLLVMTARDVKCGSRSGGAP